MDQDRIPDPFHPGEREAQARAGFRVPSAPIRDRLIPQHQDFYPLLPWLLVAARDEAGDPAAGVLTGAPGFVAAADPRTLWVRPDHGAWQPWPTGPAVGDPVAALGIDLGTRRRNRVNGRVAARDGVAFAIAVEESFGNCPQYIHVRRAEAVPPSPAGAVEALVGLDGEARRLIGTADTAFVASASSAGHDGRLDMSHRGGPAGFIRIDGDRLIIPDYAGNRYFNTLGNMLLNPRAGLLLVEAASGDVLHLTGAVGIDWHPDPALPNAQRSWSLHVERGWRRKAAIPLRWTRLEDGSGTP
ncbi:pyridoxamine 5'-phosphate oxidase family protein [Azospirillum sp.]|uniref:pyridoxamine 5'-phosphate oxidase family protein n=1 Tax=Azospirillum sp. TaxID=34012 RepID=UPI002D711828|nr:pyridoxamine 5'-phosphate oxidase family protein [Azospirillum sp.]HYF86767.1 pyridoxamine 5'-phosphate oxidase family protein [Azospirillum sp.]